MAKSHKYEQYAKKIKLFNGLEAEEVYDILHQGHSIQYHAGDSIFYKGQMGSNLFIVFQGTVNIENEGTIISKCRAGDAFGEMSVLNHRPHSASANAASDVKLFVLSEQDIHEILKRNHAAVTLLLNIIHMLSGYLEKANTVIAKTDALKALTD
jgi:CRP-like cAMP-binding protein